MIATLTRPKNTTLDAVTHKIYGIVPDASHGFLEIQDTWISRNSSTYKRIHLPNSLEESWWRNIKTGKLNQWFPKMGGELSLKESDIVIEDYICLDVLPQSQRHRLFLEHLANINTKIKAIIEKPKYQSYRDSLFDLLKEAYTEICLYLSEIKVSTTIEFFAKINSTILQKFAEDKEIIEALNLILDLGDEEKFQEIDAMIRNSSDWAVGCIQMKEVYDKKLFRSHFKSFEEWTLSIKSPSNPKGINAGDGLKRVKSAELIQKLELESLPIPQNRGQAYALLTIPIENQLKVWQMALDCESKVTSSLIKKIHKELLFGKKDESNETCSQVRKLLIEIENLRSQGAKTTNSGNAFVVAIKNEQTPNQTDLKMLKTLYFNLKQQINN